MPEEKEEYDLGSIAVVVGILSVIACITIITYIGVSYWHTIEYRKECRQNPQLLWSTSCKNIKECTNTCAQHLKETRG